MGAGANGLKALHFKVLYRNNSPVGRQGLVQYVVLHLERARSTKIYFTSSYAGNGFKCVPLNEIPFISAACRSELRRNSIRYFLGRQGLHSCNLALPNGLN